MSAKERAALIAKLHKVCKKHYQEIKPPSGRTLLEHAIYGCCLEDASYESADEAFARLQADYFDWNEVRVTTVAELAEVCRNLNAPEEAAARIKKTLHGIFETYYSFDIDMLRKENLGKAVGQFEKFRGVSPFVVSYFAQHGLGGHSIPLDQSLLNLLVLIGAITEAEAEKGKVPGLERTIPKSKGTEFSSVTHQLAAAFHASPFSRNLRDLITEIAPDAKDRFPKRGGGRKKSAADEAETAEPAKTADPAEQAEQAEKKPAKKSAAKSATKSTSSKKGTTRKSSAKASAGESTAKTPRKKTSAKSTTSRKKSTTKRLAKKKPR